VYQHVPTAPKSPSSGGVGEAEVVHLYPTLFSTPDTTEGAHSSTANGQPMARLAKKSGTTATTEAAQLAGVLVFKRKGDWLLPFVREVDGREVAASVEGEESNIEQKERENPFPKEEKEIKLSPNDHVQVRGIDFYIPLDIKNKYSKKYNIRYQSSANLVPIGYKKGSRAGEMADVAIIFDHAAIEQYAHGNHDTEITDEEVAALRNKYFTLPRKDRNQKPNEVLQARDRIVAYLEAAKDFDNTPFISPFLKVLKTRFEHSVAWEYEMGGTGFRYTDEKNSVIHFHIRAKNSPVNYVPEGTGAGVQMLIHPEYIDEKDKEGQDELKKLEQYNQRVAKTKGFGNVIPFRGEPNGPYTKLQVNSDAYTQNVDYYWHSHYGKKQEAFPSASDLQYNRSDRAVLNNFQINIYFNSVAMFRGTARKIERDERVLDHPENDYTILIIPYNNFFKNTTAVSRV
jgi:hypothetical protein